MATRSNSTAISNSDLIRMKMKAGLIETSNPSERKQLELYNKSLQRTSQWTDNYRDLKKRKQEEKYKKFEKQQLQRRRIDEQQRAYQQVLKENELKKANNKLFQNTEQVRALNSQLLFSDTLKGREEQLDIKKYLNDIQKNREQYYHQETLNQIQRQKEQDRLAKDKETQKNRKFEKDIRKQHKQVKKQYIQKMREEIEQGQLLRMKATAAIQEQENKEKARRDKAYKLNQQIKVINSHNQDLKSRQLEKERQQEARIEDYRKNQEMLNQYKKKTQQDLINEKIKQREQLYRIQADKLSKVKSKEVERLNKQIEELQAKQAAIQMKKQEQRKILKAQYEQSLKDQVEKKKREKEQQSMQNQTFKNTWNSKLKGLSDADKADDQFRKNLAKKNADDLKRQMDEKQRARQQKFRKELQQAQKVKAHLEDQEMQFKSYAEKSVKEWQDNGKNLIPIIKHLAKTMKEA